MHFRLIVFYHMTVWLSVRVFNLIVFDVLTLEIEVRDSQNMTLLFCCKPVMIFAFQL